VEEQWTANNSIIYDDHRAHICSLREIAMFHFDQKRRRKKWVRKYLVQSIFSEMQNAEMQWNFFYDFNYERMKLRRAYLN
jgi:hypothetical protein